jgi:hypothetical protein
MFVMWAVIAFNAVRASGRWRSGVAAGAVAAVATFSVFVVLNFVRINAFLDELTARPDWQTLMTRFRVSGGDNLRLFINVDYLKETPFKLAVATTFGAICGGLGGTVGWSLRVRSV